MHLHGFVVLSLLLLALMFCACAAGAFVKHHQIAGTVLLVLAILVPSALGLLLNMNVNSHTPGARAAAKSMAGEYTVARASVSVSEDGDSTFCNLLLVRASVRLVHVWAQDDGPFQRCSVLAMGDQVRLVYAYPTRYSVNPWVYLDLQRIG